MSLRETIIIMQIKLDYFLYNYFGRKTLTSLVLKNGEKLYLPKSQEKRIIKEAERQGLL